MDMNSFMKLGQECGLQGKDLLTFVESRVKQQKEELRQQQEAERDERMKDREDRENERVEREKEREHEIELAQLRGKSNAAKNIPYNVPNLPVFRADSDELDAYILRFERHATLQKWSKDCWACAC